jgi:MtfA peptidase
VATWRRSVEPPVGWEATAETTLPHFDALDADERADLGSIIGLLLGRKRWEASKGFHLTDEMRLVIAAQAALLALGLDADCYHEVRAIIVHPSTRVLRGPRPTGVSRVVVDGPFPVVGQAHGRRGPVILAWDAVRRDLRRPDGGHNVVFHEFAHKLDMLDGMLDGTPPLPDRATLERWVAVCTAEYEALRDGAAGPLLRAYAGTNPGEFFAVATEVFFVRPVELEAEKPDLYEVLSGFYRQDPAGRVRRSESRSGRE